MSKPSIATRLVDLALGAGVELFHTPDGEPFAGIPAESHTETWPVRSSGFRLWLRRIYYQSTRATAGSQAIDDALGTIEGEALFDGAVEPVHVRVAEADGAIYLDLADPYWRVVEIVPSGWRVLDRSPLRFIRPKGLGRLPEPAAAGAIDGLRDFLTVDDDGWRLMAGWLLATLRPGRPFPILALYGEQGSAKSTQAKMLRRLVDPNVADLRPCPREEYDLVLAAKNGWILGFDNVSEIKPWLSDALCRVSTGIGFGRRRLYTDGDEYLLSVKRPSILNGIAELSVRGDFADRSIIQGVPVIAADKRRDEEEVWPAFERAAPSILAGLLDVVAGALRDLPRVHLSHKPRMADFARWVTAAEPTLGWSDHAFLRSYLTNSRRAVEVTLEASLIVDPVRAVLAEVGRWEGPATQLLARLASHVDERAQRNPGWPPDGTRLAGELRRVAPALRRIGIEVEFPKTGKRRVIIENIPGEQREEREEREPGSDGHAPHAPHADSASFSFRSSNGTGAREPGEDDDDPTPCWTG